MASLLRARRDRQDGRRSRWLAAMTGLGAAGTAALALAAPAAAAPTPVTATLSVTGVTTSNCTTLAAGGSDVYLRPGQALQVRSSLVGVTLLGLPLTTGQIAGFKGQLTVDPGTAAQRTVTVGTAKRTLSGLATGNHAFRWDARTITLLGLPTKLRVDATRLKLGAQLVYTGTIHVTKAAAHCGVAAQVPGTKVTGNAGGMPTTPITLPPVHVGGTTPSASGTHGGGQHTPPPSTGSHSPTPTTPGKQQTSAGRTNNASDGSSPASAGGNASGAAGSASTGGSGLAGGGRGGFGNAYPGTGGLVLNHGGSATTGQGGQNGAGPEGTTPSQHLAAAKHGQKNPAAALAADGPTRAQMPLLLAILAIIALSLVTAAYARLYLLGRS